MKNFSYPGVYPWFVSVNGKLVVQWVNLRSPGTRPTQVKTYLHFICLSSIPHYLPLCLPLLPRCTS